MKISPKRENGFDSPRNTHNNRFIVFVSARLRRVVSVFRGIAGGTHTRIRTASVPTPPRQRGSALAARVAHASRTRAGAPSRKRNRANQQRLFEVRDTDRTTSARAPATPRTLRPRGWLAITRGMTERMRRNRLGRVWLMQLRCCGWTERGRPLAFIVVAVRATILADWWGEARISCTAAASVAGAFEVCFPVTEIAANA